MTTSQTAEIKHVFLDIVGYSRNRTVEAQTDIIEILNKIVLSVMASFGFPSESVIFIPTGDGLCISLINVTNPYDAHVQIALAILAGIQEANDSQTDLMRSFKVRIGINENVDNVVIDINGKPNITGAGINTCQRIMSLADGSQVLVSRSVFDRLSNRDKYANRFKEFKATVKHSMSLSVYQLLDSPDSVVNSDTPGAFGERGEWHLNELVAYLLARIVANKQFISEHIGPGQNNYALFVLMSMLAEDSVDQKSSSSFAPFESCLLLPEKSLDDNYSALMSLPFTIVRKCRDLFFDYNLGRIWGYKYLSHESYYLEVSDAGKKKLRSEWPAIAKEFGI